MTVAKKVCPVCGEGYWNTGAHAERCRGPRPAHLLTDDELRERVNEFTEDDPPPYKLRQPVYKPYDWAAQMEDEDADDRRVAPYLSDDVGREP